MILKLNETQNNLQLIQINNGFVVVDLVAKIKKDDWYWDNMVSHWEGVGPLKMIGLADENSTKLVIQSSVGTTSPIKASDKIIFASQSLNLDGVKIIEENTDISDLAEIKRTEKYVDGSITTWVKNDWQSCYKEGFIEGYKHAKENSYYTLEQLKEAFEVGRNYQLTGENNFIEFVNSLNNHKVEITFDKNNQPVKCKLL